jgi:dCMP deaminase
MKDKHIQNRIEQCLKISELSNCPRRKFGALLLDPINNIVLIDAYNGGPRGGGDLCGGNVCLRDTLKIPSGQQAQIGCHHAEMNVICNAARIGRSTDKMWIICTGEPCLMCAKLIHHGGIEKVIVIKGGYAVNEGAEYLAAHGIKVEFVEVEGHKDVGR